MVFRRRKTNEDILFHQGFQNRKTVLFQAVYTNESMTSLLLQAPYAKQ